MEVAKLTILDALCKRDSGVLEKKEIRSLLAESGLGPQSIQEVFEQGGFVGETVPYDELVDRLCGIDMNRCASAEERKLQPGVGMTPAELASVPADSQREVVLQTLVLLLAATSWAMRGADRGQLRVDHAPSTPDAYLRFSISSATTLSETAALAQDLTEHVKSLIATATLTLSVMPASQAECLLQAEGFCGCIALLRSVAQGDDSVGLHSVSMANGTFRTPAVAQVAVPNALQAVPWDVVPGASPGTFHLIGPTTDLSKLATSDLGRLGPVRELDAGVVECNEAAKEWKQTNVALQAEAIHENSLAEVSARIAAAAEREACVVIVAGPSSSGKTTFSCRLALHIQARGVLAQPLECDMYYKARLDPTHPRDAKGELNFEVPEALRLDRIKKDIKDLTSGKPVELPKFCFKNGTVTEETGNVMQLPAKAVLIIEGIFGLHPTFLDAFGEVSLFKVLIGPWSGARLGNLHVVPERKLRLLRRVGRDVRSRGVDAARVLHKFTSVSVGEVANIFPFAGSADVIFDSALHYELPALNAVIGKDVRAVSSDDPVVLARKAELVNYLSWVRPWSTDSYSLLPTSIACEFLGNSIFE